MTRPKSADRARSAKRPRTLRAASGPRPLLEVLAQAGVAALIVCRWLVPTEASVYGETLWITQLWLAVAVLWAWHAIREERSRFRFDWWDVAVWTLVAGHVIAVVSLLVTGGEKRAALNMLWEWVALGLTFSLVRRQLTSNDDVRRLLLVMVAMGGMLAGWGIWQHFVTIPRTVAEYDRAVAELERLQDASAPIAVQQAADRQARVRQIQFELFSQGIPLEGPARKLQEFRLRASRQPFGPFALTNTLAGFLVALLILAGALTFGTLRQTGFGLPMIVSLLATALIACCLFLTGSRTAFVGLLAGLVTAVALGIRWDPASRWSKGLTAGLAVIAILAGLLAYNGIGDDLVRSTAERAAKSLRYRMEYWTAAWEVAWERPLVGIGPGNFRQHYLEYKLPQSSEEIADPHNLILDLWASGGAIALAGLAGLWYLVVRHLSATGSGFTTSPRPVSKGQDRDEGFANHAEFGPPPDLRPPAAAKGERIEVASRDHKTGVAARPAAHDEPWRFGHPLIFGAAAGFLLVLAVGLVSGRSTGTGELALLAGWLSAAWLLAKPQSRATLSPTAVVAALTALTVHLLGAGGIEMPAIVQTMLLMLVVLIAGDELRSANLIVAWQPRVLVAGIVAVSLFLLCLATATVPVANRRALVIAGDAAWVIEHNPDAAVRHYRQAVQADPFSSDAAEKLSEVSFLRWESSRSATNHDFAQGIEFAQIAIDRNPNSPHGFRRFGNWYMKRFERTKDPTDAAKGTALLRKAVEMYPTQPFLRAELALAFQQAGQPQLAVDQAEYALRLHEINLQYLHDDKFLPYETAAAMRRIRNRAGRQDPPQKAAPTGEDERKP